MSATLRERLQALRLRGVLDDLDAHFGGFMLDLHPDGGEALAFAAALASRAAGQGHACLDLEGAAGRALLDGEWTSPSFHAWRASLLASGAAAESDARRPLVLDGPRLYLQRYWRYENEIAADLRARAASPLQVDEARLAAGLARLFGNDGGDLQRLAAQRAVRNRVMVISGGPGTGKTTTVAKILALLIDQAPDRAMAIGLAAPTGKAAARLQSAIAAARPALALPPERSALLPANAQTLHRLIGLAGPGGRARHDAERPLPLDVLVVDEASMVDLALAARVLRAMPPQARLVLLGDRDQLASVEPGAVFAAVCAGLPPENVVTLEQSHRFPPDSGIGRFARAVRDGDAHRALDVLASGPDGIAWHASHDARHALELALAGFAPLFEAVADGADPERCFAALDRFRVLCASRLGPLGMHAVNRGIVSRLQAEGRAPRGARHFVGQPIMVTRNDYGLRLFNGDVGVVVSDGADGLAAAFPQEGGGHRLIGTARLPEWETVYAMTVHKSQGSELDSALVLPVAEREGLVTRELLYTGVTRVRSSVTLIAPRDALANAIRTVAARDSGLETRLKG